MKPRPIDLDGQLKFYKVTKVKAGVDTTAVITEDGFAMVMGANDCGQLGLPLMHKKSVYELRKIDFFA